MFSGHSLSRIVFYFLFLGILSSLSLLFPRSFETNHPPPRPATHTQKWDSTDFSRICMWQYLNKRKNAKPSSSSPNFQVKLPSLEMSWILELCCLIPSHFEKYSLVLTATLFFHFPHCCLQKNERLDWCLGRSSTINIKLSKKSFLPYTSCSVN